MVLCYGSTCDSKTSTSDGKSPLHIFIYLVSKCSAKLIACSPLLKISGNALDSFEALKSFLQSHCSGWNLRGIYVEMSYIFYFPLRKADNCLGWVLPDVLSCGDLLWTDVDCLLLTLWTKVFMYSWSYFATKIPRNLSVEVTRVKTGAGKSMWIDLALVCHLLCVL